MSKNQGETGKQVQRAAVFQLPSVSTRNEKQNCMAWHSTVKLGHQTIMIVLHGIICRRNSSAFTLSTVGSLWIYMFWKWVLFVCYCLPLNTHNFQVRLRKLQKWLENWWVYKNTPYILNVPLLVFNLHGLFLLCKGRVCSKCLQQSQRSDFKHWTSHSLAVYPFQGIQGTPWNSAFRGFPRCLEEDLFSLNCLWRKELPSFQMG